MEIKCLDMVSWNEDEDLIEDKSNGKAQKADTQQCIFALHLNSQTQEHNKTSTHNKAVN